MYNNVERKQFPKTEYDKNYKLNMLYLLWWKFWWKLNLVTTKLGNVYLDAYCFVSQEINITKKSQKLKIDNYNKYVAILPYFFITSPYEQKLVRKNLINQLFSIQNQESIVLLQSKQYLVYLINVYILQWQLLVLKLTSVRKILISLSINYRYYFIESIDWECGLVLKLMH